MGRVRATDFVRLIPAAILCTPLGCSDREGPTAANGQSGSGNNNTGQIPSAPVVCLDGADAAATALDFTDNVLASPAPPGALDPADAPQIIVLGWDDIANLEGMVFVNELLEDLQNPDGTPARIQLNPNGCYARGYTMDPGYMEDPPVNTDPELYACGDGSMSSPEAKPELTKAQFDMGNHTIDHLESDSIWAGIPEQYKNPVEPGWRVTDTGLGPGVYMDEETWTDVLTQNDTALKTLFNPPELRGFRAPRLEINDAGFKALVDLEYYYSQDLEELLPEGYVDAAIAIETEEKQGFNWAPWPYTLDNGSRGVWIQHRWGDKDYLTDYPTGLWQVPVSQLYVPTQDDLGAAIADAMLTADQNCEFPEDTPEDQQAHCFLDEGELLPGEIIKEVTAFDFNTFIYSRMTAEQWLATMKHSLLMRFYGNRAPLTYGAHPVEYTEIYDSMTLGEQPNNYGFRDVVDYTTYEDRKVVMREFIAWVREHPELSKETYFLSARQMVDYMRNPFDKAGAPVPADVPAEPRSNALFSRLGFTEGPDATITAEDGNTADISFTVEDATADTDYVIAGVPVGALKHVTHIDIRYTTDVPFRVRLVTSAGMSTTVLLAGVGGDRQARIRIKDFVPADETDPEVVATAPLVDEEYMGTVAAIAFESAATAVTGAGPFSTHIEQLTLHGVATEELCSR